MVVNAAMVAMAAHYGEKTQIVYHVTSAHQNPLQCYLLEESTYGYFFINPRVRDDMRTTSSIKSYYCSTDILISTHTWF